MSRGSRGRSALRSQMRLELARLHQQVKTTMIYVTHDQIEAMTRADKIVVLGKVGLAIDTSNAHLFGGDGKVL